jgi:rhamnogalacturonyl hydrolase YesR
LKEYVFPTENIVEFGSNSHLKESYQRKYSLNFTLGVSDDESVNYWESFVAFSVIPDGFRNSGLHYAGYIADRINQWCLPSWIWTNASIVRLYCKTGDIVNAKRIAGLLIEQQQDCGGWLVRFDYSSEGAIPTLAPNDSAYIANNAFLELYKVTHDFDYLRAAIKCADWIIETARPDGIVWSGYDLKHDVWIKEHNIVDIGFTAALFANLYEVTYEMKYRVFLEKFVTQYIRLFYKPKSLGFATSLNEFDEQFGGMFARGQAWALEGLIPAFRVLNTEEIKNVIVETIKNLLSKQLQNGGWAYNFTQPFLGEDCKAVSVIAKNLLEWNQFEPNPMIIISARKALIWCQKRTSNRGEHMGGIFSYNMEGAIVHNLYTQTAFVYSSSYAIELYINLKKL